ncbi:MAG TPA: hypothetical protein VGK00_00440 [Anaerolineales bacterium]|jgi:hypothetical protein
MKLPHFPVPEPVPFRPISESYWVVPGRLLAGEYPAKPYAPENARRRLDAFLEAGFDIFVNLTRPDELPDYAPLLMEQAGYYNMTPKCLRFPVGDFGLPTPVQMTAVLDALDAVLEQGSRVYIHCHGGIGRTGTVVGCFLVRHGLTGEQALQQLSRWWKSVPKSAVHPHSPETNSQAEFIRTWPERRVEL